tara:strand:- start:376 stop:1173 length:798 start_codon:yes stop_codon:yes gene_type:complete
MNEDIDKFVKFANKLADEARTISLFYFKKKLNIKSKDQKKFDPVTIADINVQKKINKIIKKNYPSHSILGEELSIKNKSDFEWCIDPIDGTKSYIQGIPLWGTLIALSKKDQIILGLVDIPALNERYLGYKKTAYKLINGKKLVIKVGKNKKLKNAILNTTSPYVFANKSDQNSFERLSKKTKSTRLGGDCYSYCLLADGHADIIVESGLAPWDIRALEPIIKNAGGILKTWDNDNVFNGGKIIASVSKSLFNNAAEVLNKKKPS